MYLSSYCFNTLCIYCAYSFIDKKFYLDDKIYDTVINNVFNNAWQFISDVNYLKNYNVFPFVFLEDSINEPMLLINNQSVKCLSNICTHRAHTIVKKKCNKKLLQCAYHGRTFNLEGIFNHAPGFENTPNFPLDDDNLKEYPIKKWHSFLFTSINPRIKIDNLFLPI